MATTLEELERRLAAVERELADPGEPPEVDQALRIPPDLVEGLAAEVRLPEPLPAPEPDALPEFGEIPPRYLLNQLIRFDR